MLFWKARTPASGVLLGLFLFLATSGLWAQSERGSIGGVVTDQSGAAVPNAAVVITNRATNTTQQVTTGESGSYVVPNLSPGDYNVRVEKEGFKAAVVAGLTVNAASSVRADIQLEVGTSQQTVEVTGDAIALQTDNAKSATVITNKLVDDLPVVVGGTLRSPFDLAILTPESKNFGDNNFQMGGGQAASYNVSLDGVTANTSRALSNSWVAVNTPSLEAITEFSVETNGYKAEYGHAGGGQMTFVSKSGTNDLHGNAYEFLRNNDLDARRFFESKRGVYKQHDFGASVGGPVYLPKLYNGRDKTFFFFSWEAFRNRVGAGSTFTTVPTPEMYNGDFSNWVDSTGKMIPIYDPFTLQKDANGNNVRQVFPGNKIPASKFDPLIVTTLKAYQQSGVLTPNIPGLVPGTSAYVLNNYIINQGTVVSPQNKYSAKIDHTFGGRDRVSGYIGWNRTSEDPGAAGPSTLPGNYSTYNNTRRNSDVYRFSWDHNFSPTIFNHFYAGANKWAENHDPLQATAISGTNWKSIVCLPSVPDCSQNLVNIRFDSNGYGGWGGSANNGSENNVISFNNDTTMIRGSHTLKFGGMYQKNYYNGFGRQDVAGRANFSFIGTGRPGDTNFTTAGGNPFASMLLGWATNGGIDTVRYIGQQWPYFAGYFQDDWRLSRKLTLFLGMRWETTLPPMEEQDRWSDFSPTTPNPRADNRLGALIYAGTGDGRQGTRTLADSWFNGWGPRIGFAYSLSDKTVIRVNYARSYSAVVTVTGSTHQKGFTQTVSFDNASNGLSPSFLYKDGVPSYPVPPFINPSFQNGADMPWWQGQEATRLPEQNSWNLSIQRQVSPTMVIEGSYNGVVGSHLQTGLLNYNQVPFSMLSRYGAAMLGTRITSPDAINAGFGLPYSSFATDFGSRGTVAQSLRPYPQYTNIDTWSGGGDHSGHSSYHAMILKFDKRFAAGMTFTASYVFSKLITDSDSYWVTDQSRAADQYNRRLEKSIGAYDVTHNFKFAGVYELPFGKGKRWLQEGVGRWALGDWRLSYIGLYNSGRPVGLGTTIGFPLFAGRTVAQVPTYDGWAGAQKGGQFDPATDRFFQPASFFGAQPTAALGNVTRLNPKLREFPAYTENLSVAKMFNFTERLNLELRGEAFNLFNRVRFGTGNTSLQAQDFGKVTSTLNEPRRMQIGLKLRF